MKRPNLKDSAIVRFFAYLTHLFYTILPFGLLARIFSSYASVDAAFRRSAVGRTVERLESGGGKTRRTVRRNVALAMNKSRISRSVPAFWRLICGWSLRTFGALFMTMGVYAAGVYGLFSKVWGSDAVSSVNLYWGIGFVVIGVLLLFSDHSLGYALYKSFFFGKLMVSALGVSDGGVRSVERVGRSGYVVAVPLGMALGAIGALTSPVYLLVGFIALLVVLMVLSIPEAGVVMLIFAAPFVGVLPGDELWLIPLIAIPFVAYFGKLLRGNRVFHLEIQDLPVLLIALCFVFSGFSFAGDSAWSGALLAALAVAVYFLVVNLIATPAWLGRCRLAVIASATLCAVIAIVQFVFAAVNTVGEFDFITVGAAARAGFADRVCLSYFLLLVFPIVLSAFVAEQNRYRLLTGLSLLLILTAEVVAFVPAALLSLLAAFVAFLLLHYRRSLPFVMLGSGLVALLRLWIPQSAKEYLLSLLRSDVTAAAPYRSAVDSLSERILFEGGEGVFGAGAELSRILFGLGFGGTERLGMLYTAAPAQAITASMGFWTYRLLEQGVLGVILPAVFLFLLCQACFSLYCRQAVAGGKQLATCCGMLIAGVLIFGIFHYTWYDPLTLLGFFAVTAMIAAEARSKRGGCVTPVVEDMEDPGTAVELDYYGARK